MMVLLFRPQVKQAVRGFLKQFLVCFLLFMLNSPSLFLHPLPSFVLVKGHAPCEASELHGCLGHLLDMCQGRHQAKQDDEQRLHQSKPLVSPQKVWQCYDYQSALLFFKDIHSVLCYQLSHSLIEVCLRQNSNISSCYRTSNALIYLIPFMSMYICQMYLNCFCCILT